MNRTVLCAIFMWVLIVLSGCTTDMAGGGLDVESSGGTVTGTVVIPDEGPASGVKVMLIPRDHNPVTSRDTVLLTSSETDGVFHFENVDSGYYNIEGVSPGGKRFFIAGVQPSRDGSVTCTLSVPGRVRISTAGVFDKGYFYLSGTSLHTSVYETATYVQLDSVPAGRLPSVYFVNDDGGDAVMVSDSLEVRSGQLANVAAPSSWNHSAQISARSLFADVNTEFPLHDPVCLVKISEGFDFSQAQPDGADIRFYSGWGIPLEYEIEHWGMLDGSMQGHVWVAMDSLSSEDDYITMYWGNGAAKGQSSGEAVFDTARGFVSVYHLKEEDPETSNTDVYRDATYNGNHAMDNIRAVGRGGVAGYGKEFELDGTPKYDFIVADESRLYDFGTGPFTASFWFRRDTLAESSILILKDSTLEDNSRFGVKLDESNRVVVYRQVDDVIDTVSVSEALELGTWYWVNVVRDGTGTFSLYVNDSRVDSRVYEVDFTNESCGKLLIVGTDLKLGEAESDAGLTPFVGNLDELRIERVARGEEWIRAVYGNVTGAYTEIEVR
ncbi:MAG: DUF2341 domain-containing protein [Chitinispirillaceae bacterium]